MRWLTNLVVLGVLFGLLSTAEAQVFKPKGKKADVIEKKPAKASAKKSKVTKKKVAAKKKNAAADRSRPDDLTPEPGSKSDDDDFVKITDDDEIE